MKSLNLDKGIEEVYRAILRWAEGNEMGIEENSRDKEGFVLKFRKLYTIKQKFSWGLAVFLFFLGIILVGVSENTEPGSPEAFFMSIFPLLIYLIVYFLKKKPKEAVFSFSARAEEGEVLLKSELVPENLEPAKKDLTQLVNKLV